MNNLMFGLNTISSNNQISEDYSLELKQSALKLKKLIEACKDELNQAEHIFNSKPKILEIAKPNIFEQITLVSGSAVKIRYVGNQYKTLVIEQASQSWEEQIEKLRQKWFIDAKQQLKKGIGWNEKSNFTKEMPSELEAYYQSMFRIIRENLREMHKEIAVIDLGFIQNISNPKYQVNLHKKVNSTLGRAESKFCDPTEYLTDRIKNFKTDISTALEVLVNKGWGDILWEEVIKFKNELLSQIIQVVTSIFDNRVEWVVRAAEEVISFYNDFLERQERYQQETPEQREAEKAWIDQQRQQLEQVHDGIEAILKAS